MWRLYVIGDAKKQFKKLPRHYQKHIRNSLDQLKIDPFTQDVVRLGSNDKTWRLRVGSYRVFFELFQKEKAVFIYAIKRRTSTTY